MTTPWTPPPALVQKALRAYRMEQRCADCSVLPELMCCAQYGLTHSPASMTAALTASGMGDLVALADKAASAMVEGNFHERQRVAAEIGALLRKIEGEE